MTLLHKSLWGPGPWRHEPDRVEWQTDTDYPALALRSSVTGSWCGYIAVPPGHPWHGREHDELDVEVHGGLTYSGGCVGEICHVTVPGEPDDVWWLGFDCAHVLDHCPALHAMMRDVALSAGALPAFVTQVAKWPAKYRTLEFVRRQVEELGDQARAVTVMAS